MLSSVFRHILNMSRSKRGKAVESCSHSFNVKLQILLCDISAGGDHKHTVYGHMGCVHTHSKLELIIII